LLGVLPGLAASIIPAAVSAAGLPSSADASSTVVSTNGPSSQAAQFLKLDTLKAGQTLTASSSQSTSILTPLGTLVMTPGSSLELMNNGSWKASVGKFHLALRDAATKPQRFISRKARLTTKGATFNLEVAADGAIKVEVVSDTYQLPQSLLSTSKGKITQTQKLGGKLYFDSSRIYYPGSTTGTWNKFQDKGFTDYMFKLARDKDITYDFDKQTFKFVEWVNRGPNRYAVYEGNPSAVASDALIKNTISQDMPPTSELAKPGFSWTKPGGGRG